MPITSERQQCATDAGTIAPRWIHLWHQHGIIDGTLACILAHIWFADFLVDGEPYCACTSIGNYMVFIHLNNASVPFLHMDSACALFLHMGKCALLFLAHAQCIALFFHMDHRPMSPLFLCMDNASVPFSKMDKKVNTACLVEGEKLYIGSRTIFSCQRPQVPQEVCWEEALSKTAEVAGGWEIQANTCRSGHKISTKLLSWAALATTQQRKVQLPKSQDAHLWS